MIKLQNFDVFEFDELTSTSTYLKTDYLNYKKHDVIWSLEQSEGRGQYDRVWSSSSGGLYFSVLLEPNFERVQVEDLIIDFSTHLKLYLQKNYQIEVRIKAPNDVYYGDKKLCGVLIENSFLGSNLEYCIMGIGINVNQNFSNQDDLNAISISEILGNKIELRDLLVELLDSWNPIY
ncbi:MAG: biotin--[acetyl-CoA-carboxylase] ligase [Candidatus Cloacimonetes bacterium]|nr:biotin--[acetyl-CoA-carboxylase] ligase [Candidatus Cloacimonadota bacterium]